MSRYFEIMWNTETPIARQVLSSPAFGFLLQRGCRMDLELLINVLCFVEGVFLESESMFANTGTYVSEGYELCS